jgi:carotenoid 1,2-hydratase
VLTPAAVTGQEAVLDGVGRHIWRPFAPVARIAVDLTQGQRWRGHGYFDANFGTRALETDFARWSWGRYPLADGAACFYDASRHDGGQLALAVRADHDGGLREVAAPPLTRFRRTLWALHRDTRADPGTTPRQRLAMLDAPFYSRSLVETRLWGETSTGVHEALDLTRFAKPWLKPMLALRVPRRAAWPPDRTG